LINKSFLKNHFPVIFLCVLIFVLSSIPGQYYPEVNFEFSDKIVHFGIYFVLAIAFYMSLSHQNRYKLLAEHSFVFAVIFTGIYGASDELHQYFVPNRSCDFYDFLANLLGAITAMALINYFVEVKRNRKRVNAKIRDFNKTSI